MDIKVRAVGWLGGGGGGGRVNIFKKITKSADVQGKILHWSINGTLGY